MSIKKFATSAAVITSLVAAGMAPLATAANAHGDRNNGSYGYSPKYSKYYDGPRHAHNYGARYYYGKKHRHNHGRDVATGLAIGLGVLAVGSILAHGR
jgi:hypothetical protein